MAITIRLAVSIQKLLFDQAESLARQLHISPSHLVGLAIEYFFRNCQSQAVLDEIKQAYEHQPGPAGHVSSPDPEEAVQMGGGQKAIHQGEIYWVPLEEPEGLEPGYTHPHVVIQDNVFNHSRLTTVVVCALSTNMKRAKAPGNVLLETGEAGLPRQSVVVVSQVATVDKTQLGDYIGTLTKHRVSQILSGMQFLQSLTEHHSVSTEE